MNQMKEQQEVVKEKLAQLRIEESSSDGIVKMVLNGEHEMLDLKIDWDQAIDNDMVEDLLIATFNAANVKVTAAIADVTKNSLSGILPPGLSDMI